MSEQATISHAEVNNLSYESKITEDEISTAIEVVDSKGELVAKMGYKKIKEARIILFGNPPLDFYVRESDRNKGIATQLGRRLLQKIANMEDLGDYDVIQLMTSPTNVSAQRMAEKMGFTHQYSPDTPQYKKFLLGISKLIGDFKGSNS